MFQVAKIAARKAIESTYNGVATIEEYQKVKDENTKLTKVEPVVVVEDQPCRLSFESLQTANQTETAASITQSTKLFISPDITVNAGSKITVTQSGVTNVYTRSGVPAVYETHQEIMLVPFEGWA